MIIEAVDLFYLAMPQIRDIADGSQDALLVRVRSGDLVGWGECEASPLVSIANWACPMSHAACKNVRDTVLGRRLESPQDLVRLGDEVRAAGLDILQTDHTWSGVEIALWDILGKHLEQPVYRLLGYSQEFGKTPYASQLFGETPDETRDKAKRCREAGFAAVKFGWAGYGRSTVQADADQVEAARTGLGPDGVLLIDAGTVWGEDVEAAAARLPALEANQVLWLEEPFVGDALHAYGQLASQCRTVKLAGGEGAFNFHTARNLMDHGKLGFVQIDTGRIGGIAPAKRAADYAESNHVTFVNHTFTTHLALAASLAPYAGKRNMELCEFPVEASALATELTANHLNVQNGKVRVLDEPGLGMQIRLDTIRKYAVPVQINVGGRVVFASPEI